jgi:predicted CXXCH cytochrome family protein
LLPLCPARAQEPTPAQLENTPHNLSKTGPGTIKAIAEDRICIFCHTPHNAAPQTPLWNRALEESRTYTVYTSPTMNAVPQSQPTGATKLCLSCHDGLVASLGAVLNPAGGIAMAGGGLPGVGMASSHGVLSNFGTDLSGHHPVAFPYLDAVPDAELVSSPPPELTYGGDGEVHCTTCHDPHRNDFGRFLVKENRYSGLCITCHQIPDWAASPHATSTADVSGILPRPPRTWPQWSTLAEWACESCHAPHFAPTATYLLNFTDTAPEPYSCETGGCHGGTTPPHTTAGIAPAPALGSWAGGRVDISRQLAKPSAHRRAPAELAAASGGRNAARTGMRVVGCSDCHDPHAMRQQEATAPYVSGLVDGSPGVDRRGAEIERASFEYEICLRCHGDDAGDAEFVPRAVASTNNRLDFDPANASTHAVIERARAVDVPSIPSALSPGLTASDQVYCTSCHADDEGGSSGPHGSQFAPILRERYETGDGTPESLESYALCYRCHERESILRDDSFRPAALRTTASGGGHRGHLAAGISCAACHDPHGVPTAQGLAPPSSGDHTHLVNFDLRVAQPLPGATLPVFRDAGPQAGSCALVCHGVVHGPAVYP